MSNQKSKSLKPFIKSLIKESLKETQFSHFIEVPELEPSEYVHFALFHPDDARLLSSLTQKGAKISFGYIYGDTSLPLVFRLDESEKRIIVKRGGMELAPHISADKASFLMSSSRQKAFKKRFLKRLLTLNPSTSPCFVEPFSFWIEAAHPEGAKIELGVNDSDITIDYSKSITDSTFSGDLFVREINIESQSDLFTNETELFKRSEITCCFKTSSRKPQTEKRKDIFLSVIDKIFFYIQANNELARFLRPDEIKEALSTFQILLKKPRSDYWHWIRLFGEDVRDPSSNGLGLAIVLELSFKDDYNEAAGLNLKVISRIKKNQPDFKEMNRLDTAIADICYEASGAIALYEK